METGAPVFWGGSGYPTLWNEAPFLNNQDLFIIKDDYTKVFGKHFVKAGVLASFNKKNEDTDRQRSRASTRASGVRPGTGLGGTTGNILADFLLRDMTFGFSEASTGRSAPQRWRDVEMYVADSWQVSRHVHVRFRRALLTALQPVHDRQQDHELRAGRSSIRRSGNDPCNGLLQPPGSNWCQDAGARGGMDGPNKTLDGAGSQQLCATARFRLGRARQRQVGGSRWHRTVLPARAADTRPQHRDQSTVCDDHSAASASWIRRPRHVRAASGRGWARRHAAAKSTCGRRTTGSGI